MLFLVGGCTAGTAGGFPEVMPADAGRVVRAPPSEAGPPREAGEEGAPPKEAAAAPPEAGREASPPEPEAEAPEAEAPEAAHDTIDAAPPDCDQILVWPGVLASPGVLINGESADVAGANCYWEAFYATCESVPIPIGGHVGFKLGPYPAPDGPGYVYDLCY
jgi:hypothetical protein